MPVKKLAIDELCIGMYVEELDRPWLETDLPYQGMVVADQSDIDMLARQAKHVYVTDLAPPLSDSAAAAAGAKKQDIDRPALHDRAPLEFFEEIEHARHIRSDMRNLVGAIHDDIRAGRRLDVDTAQEMVTRIGDSVARNSEALMWFSTLKHRDDYTAQHSVHVCMLAVAFAAYLGMDDTQLDTLGLGALFHDVGKIRVPLAVLNKPGRLTEEEMAEIRKHPQHGVDILSEIDGISPDSLDVVLNHHERLDGSGYPRGISGHEISYFSQLLAICDVYDAMTSDRVYHRGRTPADVIKIMRGDTDMINQTLLEKFNAFLGDYPVGTLVELNSGEVGLIVPRTEHDSETDLDQPVVLIMLDHNKHLYYPQRLRDLGRYERFQITRVLASGAYGIDVNDYACNLQ